MAATAAVVFWDAGLTTLESAVYDRWGRRLTPVPVSPALLIVARDAASEARLGAGAWDRARLARVIISLARAGAGAIGVDVALGQPSAPGHGGASSDALLSQATALAGNVVYPTPGAGPLPGLAQHARAFGHTVAFPDADGVVRRVPLFIRVDDRAVPALGLALALVYANAKVDEVAVDGRWLTIPRAARIPVDRRGQALVPYTVPARLKIVSFLDVWTAIEGRRTEAVQELVDDRVVLLLVEPVRARHPTPVGAMSDGELEAQVLNAVLTGSWLREAPLGWMLLATLVVASLTAYMGLALRWWTALAGVAAPTSGYAVLWLLSPRLTGVLLPAFLPLAAVILASAGCLMWKQLESAYRLRHLEREVGELREALVRQESMVEALEEDLDAARAAVARSTGAERELLQASDTLRAQLTEAQAQEAQTRSRLRELEGELRAADTRPLQLDDAEQERLRQQCAAVGIRTRDPAMLAAFRDLQKAARSALPILITGEPGTGKELFARAAHRQSPRAAGPFVAVNMAAVPPELFENELFGHVKGSFTGAVGEHRGYFEQADRGTIFLDEIGELRAEHQGKLLRVLQDKTFYRVGATRPSAVDVRVVAASNRDLERGIAEGWFREDLYFRLKGLVLRLPPLRERRRDVALLAARFLDDEATEAGRRVTLSEAALLALERYDWPGNVRELQHCLRQAVALAEHEMLTPEDLRLAPFAASHSAASDDAAVLACLRQHGFDMQATAQALGWDRSTVTQRLKGLGFRALVESGGDQGRAALALAGNPELSRTVELKLREYQEHLIRAVEGFPSAEAALAACRRRFKNLPERHFRSLELLVRRHFEGAPRRTRG